jgi:hypothetical protein
MEIIEVKTFVQLIRDVLFKEWNIFENSLVYLRITSWWQF